jgi:hypothetical protein
MRISMGIVRNEHGVFHLRKKVPKKLEEAVAHVTGAAKPRVAWLKKTLNTKDHKAAKVRAAPVLMEFDRILAKAEALGAERPLRTSLSQKEVERIADYHFAAVLAEDDEMRRDGTGSEPIFQSIARQLADAGVEFKTQFHVGATPEYGLSEREMQKHGADLEAYIALAEHALARGDVSAIREQMDDLAFIFRINLDPKSVVFRQLGMAVLRKDVEALHAIERRHRGDPLRRPSSPWWALSPLRRAQASARLSRDGRSQRPPRPPRSASSLTPSIVSLSFMATCRYRRLPANPLENFARHSSSCQFGAQANCGERRSLSLSNGRKNTRKRKGSRPLLSTSSLAEFRPLRCGLAIMASFQMTCHGPIRSQTCGWRNPSLDVNLGSQPNFACSLVPLCSLKALGRGLAGARLPSGCHCLASSQERALENLRR